MTEQLKDQDRLQPMLEPALKATEFVNGRSREDLDGDEQFALSLVHLLEILGEADSRVSESFRQQRPDFPWKQATGIRNRLIHGYFDVDYDIVWRISTEQFPEPINRLKRFAA